ncbi:MAG: PilT/PilU family type 4a pilus ATPase [Verrucomicrobiota bacterium]
MDENSPEQSGPKSFRNDVRLFACKLIDEKVLDFNAFDRLVDLAPSGADLLDFGQLIIDHDICEDFEKVQAILDATCNDIEAGVKAPYDPFDTGECYEELAPESKVKAPDPKIVSSAREAPSPTYQPEATPARKKIPLPKKVPQPEEPAVEKVAEDPSPTKIKFVPSENEVVSEPLSPEANLPADTLMADDESISGLANQALQSLGEATDGAVGPVSSQKRPIDLKPEAPTAKRVSLNEDTLESLAAAASAAIDLGKRASMGVENMPQMAPVHAQSKAEKPGETWISAKGVTMKSPDFASLTGTSEEDFKGFMISLLLYCAEEGYSDLHISADARPFARKYGEVQYLSETVISPEISEALNTRLLSPEQLAYFESEQDYDCAIPFDTGHRFRTNLMKHKDGMAGSYRIVPGSPSPIDSLGYSPQRAEVLKKLLTYHNGLVLVTGPVGSGKTMTLASLVAEMNANRSDHIICVEEPIEIVHQSNQCSVTQRGVGPHTNTFHSALKGALRQDPDIIVIGEMRDLETIEMAISASETGHLVIGTMHTSDASNTLNRLLDVFPPAQQPQIRAMVAESLKGIVCQRLLPAKSGGVVLACELLLNNTAVASLIREGKSQGLSNIMETGKRDGMIVMDNSVLELFQAGKISEETARANIKNEVLLRSLNPTSANEAVPSEESKKRGFFRK